MSLRRRRGLSSPKTGNDRPGGRRNSSQIGLGPTSFFCAEAPEYRRSGADRPCRSPAIPQAIRCWNIFNISRRISRKEAHFFGTSTLALWQAGDQGSCCAVRCPVILPSCLENRPRKAPVLRTGNHREPRHSPKALWATLQSCAVTPHRDR